MASKDVRAQIRAALNAAVTAATPEIEKRLDEQEARDKARLAKVAPLLSMLDAMKAELVDAPFIKINTQGIRPLATIEVGLSLITIELTPLEDAFEVLRNSPHLASFAPDRATETLRFKTPKETMAWLVPYVGKAVAHYNVTQTRRPPAPK